MNQAFFQAGNRAPSTAAPDFDVAAIQRKGMIKADHKKNLEDAVALLKLAEELKSILEKEDPLVISVKNIKQTEDIQKLAKNIHGRLKRY
jgi:ketopantoate reductase